MELWLCKYSESVLDLFFTLFLHLPDIITSYLESIMSDSQPPLIYRNISSQLQVNIDNLRNFQFLIDATSVITSSLDYQETLAKVAQIAVPKFADWCSVHIINSSGVGDQIVVAHKDPDKVALAKKLREQYPENPNSKTGVPQVLRTGKSEIMSVIPPELIEQSVKDKEQLKIVKQLGLRSYMCVPFIARGKVLGAITLVAAESGRIYTQTDLSLVEDLARIAAIAIDNALLHKETTEFAKTLEKRVEERTEELRRSNKELQDFAYVASHDLQEPLRKIQAFGDLLKEEYGDKLDKNGSNYLDRVLNAAGRMRSLINDILTFSRVTTKALPFTTVNLNIIAQEVLSDLETRIKDLDGKISVSDLPQIQADPIQMRQLFQNLIGNALKFHKHNESPQVKIYSRKQDGFFEIYFEDNGIGIDEKYKDKIFTIFERLHSRQDFEGTGVGLAVVRKIVERHKGKIDLKSTEGKGTTFIISLPILEKGSDIHG